jgi:hypothetical protein
LFKREEKMTHDEALAINKQEDPHTYETDRTTGELVISMCYGDDPERAGVVYPHIFLDGYFSARALRALAFLLDEREQKEHG